MFPCVIFTLYVFSTLVHSQPRISTMEGYSHILFFTLKKRKEQQTPKLPVVLFWKVLLKAIRSIMIHLTMSSR